MDERSVVMPPPMTMMIEGMSMNPMMSPPIMIDTTMST
jgi:hypothetical protein